MRAEIIRCDGCKKEIPDEYSLFHPIALRTAQARSAGGSGNTREYDWVEFDLCEACAKTVVRRMLKLSEEEASRQVAKTAKKVRK